MLISGRVQGVFYRASTRDTALRLGLKGWVRNLPDGTVEAVFEGPLVDLQNAVEWCREGPTGAAVRHVEENWGDYQGEFSDFDIRYGF